MLGLGLGLGLVGWLRFGLGLLGLGLACFACWCCWAITAASSSAVSHCYNKRRSVLAAF